MATPTDTFSPAKPADKKNRTQNKEAYLQNKETLLGLKDRVKSGELTIPQYAQMAESLGQAISDQLKIVGSLNDYSSKWARKELGSLSSVIQFAGDNKSAYDKAYTYQDFKLPFTRQEYALLDESVLPTQQDIDKGIIARDAMPFQRLKTTPTVDAQGNPLPGGSTPTNPNAIPTDINLGTDRGAIELEAQRQASQLQSALDEQKALREANRAKMAEMLSADRDESFRRAIPMLAEEANTRGIFRSTGFGEQLAQKYSDLTRDTESKLAELEYGDSEKYAAGIGDIANVRAGLQTGGLQREFSLDDAARSEALARELAKLSQPSSSGGKSDGEKWAQGINAGANVISAGSKAVRA